MAADQITMALPRRLHVFLDLVGKGFNVLGIVENWNLKLYIM